MTVLSLFDGMACGALALLTSGIDIDSYDAFEIDKYAIKTATHNFHFIKEHGDVFLSDFNEFKGVDLLCGGSPCTYWSIAQKNNRETEASGMGWELFQQYCIAIKEAEPKYFIYENNKSMSNAIRESISTAFGFEPICINSALVSAQNRQRLYWVGRRNADGTYSKVEVEQPLDRGILLKDILVTGEDLTSNDKNYCMTASYDGACGWNTIERSQRTMVAEPVRVGSLPRPNGELSQSQAFRIYDVEGKSVNINAGGGGAGGKTGLYAIPVNTTNEGKSQTIKAQYQQTSPINIVKYKSTYGASGVAEPIGFAAPIEWDEQYIPVKAVSGADGKSYAVYKVKDGIITIKGKEYPIKLADGFYIIRKLTVRECMRLQTVPEWYDFSVVSNAQAYKMLGNGWTVDVIAHILSYIH